MGSRTVILLLFCLWQTDCRRHRYGHGTPADFHTGSMLSSRDRAAVHSETMSMMDSITMKAREQVVDEIPKGPSEDEGSLDTSGKDKQIVLNGEACLATY